MEANTLLAFEEDILNRSWQDWVKAHTSFQKPLHRYEGHLNLYADRLTFVGVDSKTNAKARFDFYKSQIDQLYLGFDEVYKSSETRSLGLGWVPLRLTLSLDEGERYVYLITNYHFGKTDNLELFEDLKAWAG